MEYAVVGSYELLEPLGEGGMGRLYLGRHITLGELAAVKVLKYHLAFHEPSQRRFWHEAQTLAAVEHPGIVELYEFGEIDQGVPYLAMEYVRGISLDEALAARNRLPVRDALVIARQVADALAAVHNKGIAHRDLKPSNIMLVDTGDAFDDSPDPGKLQVKVLDFGVAKTLAPEPDNTQITRTGIIVGTPRYMSPEQCTGFGDIDHRADIYCLGLLLYEMLAGRCPFEGGDVVARHIDESPRPPSLYRSILSQELEAGILRCLAKKPAQRYQTMKEFAEFLAKEEARVRANPIYEDEPDDWTDQRRPSSVGSGVHPEHPGVAAGNRPSGAKNTAATRILGGTRTPRSGRSVARAAPPGETPERSRHIELAEALEPPAPSSAEIALADTVMASSVTASAESARARVARATSPAMRRPPSAAQSLPPPETVAEMPGLETPVPTRPVVDEALANRLGLKGAAPDDWDRTTGSEEHVRGDMNSRPWPRRVAVWAVAGITFTGALLFVLYLGGWWPMGSRSTLDTADRSSSPASGSGDTTTTPRRSDPPRPAHDAEDAPTTPPDTASVSDEPPATATSSEPTEVPATRSVDSPEAPQSAPTTSDESAPDPRPARASGRSARKRPARNKSRSRRKRSPRSEPSEFEKPVF